MHIYTSAVLFCKTIDNIYFGAVFFYIIIEFYHFYRVCSILDCEKTGGFIGQDVLMINWVFNKHKFSVIHVGIL